MYGGWGGGGGGGGGGRWLPFTGFPLMILIAVAAVLVVGGMLLVRTLRFRYST